MVDSCVAGVERGSVAGIELLTRTSLNSLKDASQVSSSYVWGTLNHQPTDDRNWSWAYLRHQFRLKDLEKLYLQYQHQLHKGFFSVFIAVQVIVTFVHVGILLTSANMTRLEYYMPDVVSYTAGLVLILPLVIVVYRGRPCSVIPGLVAVVVMLAADLSPVLYRTLGRSIDNGVESDAGRSGPLRPAYATHTLLSVYTFLPLVLNRQALTTAVIVTAVHLLVLATITYKDSKAWLEMMTSEVVYLVCINFLGLYFRFVNEVVIRRTFLDRRACVESTLRLNFEKEQEEQLMLSILPRYIASRVKDDIRNIFQQIKTHHDAPLKQKPFRELYVEEHDNVSILYADVVNYSQLTVSLPPKKLVETLNELFTRFDEASEEHGVLRIKFLGDCYYCVAGIPVPNQRHASACVDLGLDMIAIIKEVREDRQLDIDMRIGVHSGKVLSGVLGVCKWQYDVWSRDVVIANHMEQSGKPGRVHVTGQTMSLLGDVYQWEDGHGASRDQVLQEFDVQTFLISGKRQEFADSMSVPSSRRDSGDNPYSKHKDYRARGEASGAYGSESYSTTVRQTMFMENNLIMYQQMLRKADESMANDIKQMPIGNYRTWLKMHEVNPFCLTFEDLSWEMPYLQQPDPLFKYYVAGAIAVLLCIRTIQALGFPSYYRLGWTVFGCSVCLLACLVLPVTWTHFLWNTLRDPHQELELIPEPGWPPLRLLYRASLGVVCSNSARTCLFLVVVAALAASALVNLVECTGPMVIERRNETFHEKVFVGTDCLAPWHVTETCSLVVVMCFLFLKVHFQLKLVASTLIVTVHAFSVWTLRPHLFQSGASWNPGLSPQVSHLLSMLFLTVTLHLLDRQVEYVNRLDYRWKRQLAEEQEEAATTRTVNKMLLQNILPIHVAEIYLNTSRTHEELYHEQYQSVAVLFASLIEPEMLATTTPVERGGRCQGQHCERSSLEILNHIICGFDKLLFEPSAQRVEKIKVAGRTYMAACGLEPGRRESANNSHSLIATAAANSSTENNLVVLTRFAIQMMKVLDKYNANNGYNFQLKVGIAHGAVSAGVVGSLKPLYDIWGDAVNLAARMDSTGVAGRIQVPEDTAKVLERLGVGCELRGPTYVKGKNYMTTYFISESYKLQVSTPIIQPDHHSHHVVNPDTMITKL